MAETTDFNDFATEHPNYFPGQYLLEDDFKLQHKYLSDRLRYQNQSLHVSGIIEGLEVTLIEDKKKVKIQSGSAIDSQGNLIVLKEEKTEDIPDGGGELYIQFSHQENEKTKQQKKNKNSFTRWKEEPIVEFKNTTPENAVKLAKLTISGEEVTLDVEERQYSGISLPSSNGEALTLRSGGNANSNLAVLKGSLKIDGDLTTESLKLEKGVAINKFSSDSLGDSDEVVPTERAVKDYIQTLTGELNDKSEQNTQVLQQLDQDIYGEIDSFNRDGQPRLTVSLREAVNAMLQGRHPVTQAKRLTINAEYHSPAFAVVDPEGDIWVFWVSQRAGNHDIWYKKTINKAADQWGEPKQLTINIANYLSVFAVADLEGDIWVFWVSQRAENYDIWYKKTINKAADQWDEPKQLTINDYKFPSTFAVVDPEGDIWVFWVSQRAGNHDIWYKKTINKAADQWDEPKQLTNTSVHDNDPFSVVDPEGDIWVFWVSIIEVNNYEIWYKRTIDRAADRWGDPQQLAINIGIYTDPFAVVDSGGDIWVFWMSGEGIEGGDLWCRRTTKRAADQWGDSKEVAIDVGGHPATVFALADPEGDIWVFCQSQRAGNQNIYYKRVTKKTADQWEDIKQLTINIEDDMYPIALADPEGDIWVFWMSQRAGDYDIWYQKILKKI
ncbi:MAG: hypothetical protein F6K24_15335 [Okeania sp. SIO2D1]|nr:hypothetical protein [Okeania sp. SIO2D1]